MSAPIGTSGPEFQDVAKKVAGVDTLDAFLRDMRARYPDAAAAAPGAAAAKDDAKTDGKDGAAPAVAPPVPAKPKKLGLAGARQGCAECAGQAGGRGVAATAECAGRSAAQAGQVADRIDCKSAAGARFEPLNRPSVE